MSTTANLAGFTATLPYVIGAAFAAFATITLRRHHS